MTKRRIEPILWLLFSGGGVVAAVFLPILILLFGLAIPLGLLQPDYNHLHAVVSYWLTRLVLLGSDRPDVVSRGPSAQIHTARWTSAEAVGQTDRSDFATAGALVGSVATLLIVLTFDHCAEPFDRLSAHPWSHIRSRAAAREERRRRSFLRERRRRRRYQRDPRRASLTSEAINRVQSSSTSVFSLGRRLGPMGATVVRALIRSRFSREIVSNGMPFGHTAVHSPMLVQPPNPKRNHARPPCRRPASIAPADLAAADRGA
jgi:hypothetical protein